MLSVLAGRVFSTRSRIYSALIFYLLTAIVIALAAQTNSRVPTYLISIVFCSLTCKAVDLISQPIIEIVATMGLAPSTPTIVQLNQQLTYVDAYGEVVVRLVIKKPP